MYLKTEFVSPGQDSVPLHLYNKTPVVDRCLEVRDAFCRKISFTLSEKEIEVEPKQKEPNQEITA